MSASEPRPIADDELSTIIAGLQREFLVHAEEQAQIIHAAIQGLAERPSSRALLEPLIRASHMLKGGAATFGLSPAGDAAGELERLGLAAADEVDIPALALAFDRLNETLRRARALIA